MPDGADPELGALVVSGVETAAQQVVIARIKASVRPDDPARLFRFRARRYDETGSGPGDPREPD